MCGRRWPAWAIAIGCLLQLTIVSGLSHEQMAAIYGVNQSTITRWIARAREEVLAATEHEVCARLGLPASEFRSLAGLS